MENIVTKVGDSYKYSLKVFPGIALKCQCMAIQIVAQAAIFPKMCNMNNLEMAS